jgi:hypothetical protein
MNGKSGIDEPGQKPGFGFLGDECHWRCPAPYHSICAAFGALPGDCPLVFLLYMGMNGLHTLSYTGFGRQCINSFAEAG